MPIRINLKELFGSDSQEITIDKLNFNFNKLLELGVGLKGDRGLTGPVGPAGPIGPIGPKGDQGNHWFVGTGDPNGLSLNPADEDFYMDTDTSQIWQYDESTSLWSILIDLEGVVNDYLVVNGSPFVRGFGSSSPQDSRYITFTTRGGTFSDQAGDSKGSSTTQNDILFLNNFDESSGVLSITSDLSDTDSTYTAIQKIAVSTLGAANERYGLEIGSLYNLGSDIYLSDFNSGLKFHHVAEDITGFQVSNPDANVNNSGVDIKNYGIISVSGHYGNQSQNTDNDYLNILDLQSPRRDANAGSNEIFHTKIGSKFSLIQDQGWVRYDGILFESGSISGGIGIARDFYVSGQSGNDYLMIDSGTSADGILLNNQMYQDGGDIKQLGTGDLEIGSTLSRTGLGFNLSKSTYGNGAILNSGDLLYVIESISTDGSTSYADFGLNGRIYSCDVSNELNPLYIDTVLGSYYYVGPPVQGYPKTVVGSGIIDSNQIGDHLVLINDMDPKTYTSPSYTGWVQYDIINLQTVKYNGTGSSPSFERLGIIIDDQDLHSAYRIETSGNVAIVATNRLKYWEDLGASGPSAAGSNYNASGKLVLVDLSNIENPIKGDVYTDPDVNHYLDIYKMDQGLYAIPSIKLGSIDGTNSYFSNCELRLNIATVNNGSISVESVQLATISNLQNINYEDSTVWSPFATVTAHEGWIYVAHQNTIYVCQYTVDGLSVYSTYSYDPDSEARALDSKLLGDTLYILIGTGGTDHWSPTDSSIVKVNISDRNNPVTVNKTGTGEASSTKLTIVGNSVYINKVNGPGSGFLIPIKFNGLYSDGANIGSLKSGKISVSDSLNVGRSLNVNSGITVGANGIVSTGDIAANVIVSNKLRIPSGSNPEHLLGASTGPTFLNYLAQSSSSRLGIGTASPTKKLDVDGELRVRTLPAGATSDNVVTTDTSGVIRQRTGAQIVKDSGEAVPTGTIVMWGGTEASIPTGWLLCNGQAAQGQLQTNLFQQGNPFGIITIYPGGIDVPKVPDLRERFIVGARFDVGGAGDNTSNYNVGQSGGENEVTLTKGEIPPHVHAARSEPGATINIMSSGDHQHTIKWTTVTTDNGSKEQVLDHYNPSSNQTLYTTWGTGNHTHPNTSFSGTVGDGTNNGVGGNAHENRPPYFALCFIIKYI